MRHIKRFRLFAGEASVLLVGFVLSGVLVVWINPWIGEKVFWLGMVATAVGFFALRQKHRAWKIEYDAEGWRTSRVERELHPKRALYKRIARRILIWVPSVIAALVLFFFPAVSHVAYSRDRYLTPYRIPIPWSFAVWRPDWPRSMTIVYGTSLGLGRFGVSPYWGRDFTFSLIVFDSNGPRRDLGPEIQRQGASQIASREFRLGGSPLTCWQYLPSRQWKPAWLHGAKQIWEVECENAPSIAPNFYARFYGREEDLQTFYSVVEFTTP